MGSNRRDRSTRGGSQRRKKVILWDEDDVADSVRSPTQPKKRRLPQSRSASRDEKRAPSKPPPQPTT